MIEPATGNLLRSPADALVNTVNCVGVMGKGIALQFKQAFPAMFDAYAKAARAGAIVPGRVHVFETGTIVGARYILNFPTKRHWRAGSRIEDIEAGLVDLVAQVRQLGIESIAIPPLGAGNGGLDWAQVRPLIEAAFATLPEVRVYLYEPGPEPRADDRVIGTTRPTLTLARALFLRLMATYRGPDYAMTLVEVQKLAYFLQAAGEPLRLRFQRAPYGPYADNLNQVLRRLEGHFLRGATDTKPGTDITLMPGAAESAAEVLRDHTAALRRVDQVERLIEGFETPYGLELLATVHWVSVENSAAARDSSECLKGVHAWSSRKARVLRAEHITVAWNRLHEVGFLSGVGEPGPQLGAREGDGIQ